MEPYIDTGVYWESLSEAERMASCNGMGAEWMSELSREVLDFIFDDLSDGVEVHDVDYAYSPKQPRFWHIANRRMKKNFLRAVDHMPWYRYFKKRRFRNLWIPIMYKCVESKGGWQAFVDAHPPVIVNKPKVY